MSTKQVQEEVNKTGFAKDPNDWTTGDDPISIGQKSYLSTLAANFGEKLNFIGMTKKRASELINEYRKRSGLATNPAPRVVDLKAPEVEQKKEDPGSPENPPPSQPQEKKPLTNPFFHEGTSTGG